jgi:predicted Zn finger-like uncharacterized protein
LFTQCTKCETVFRLSAEVLRAAAGEVRCGRCGEVFNALTRLAEVPTGYANVRSPLEQETLADNILHFPPGPSDPGSQPQTEEENSGEFGVQIARLEIEGLDEDIGSLNEEPEWERSMEFTLPPGELDRIFVDAGPAKRRRARRKAAQSAQEQPPDPTPPADAEPPPPTLDGEPSEELFSDLSSRRREPGIGLWTMAASVLGFALAIQVVHHNRQYLAQMGGVGAALQSIYSTLGMPVTLPVNPSAFELRQWGATGEAGANGILRLRASIVNTTSTPQPYPLLRVTLADRFGGRIGERDFSPAEYLRNPPAHELRAGERADAAIALVDPGRTAEGFEIDTCARDADQHTVCANDAAPRVKQ